jgi:divalent metal cation (Fe/Co/Zn/Cd) transporter
LRTVPTAARARPTGTGVEERAVLLGTALRLCYLTIAWNGVVGGIALAVSAVDESPVLAGFALNALLDSSASVVLTWRFARERRDPVAAERLESRAQACVAAAMILVSGYVGFRAVDVLAEGVHPEASVFGCLVSAASLLILPWLGRAKLHVAARLASGAMRGDAILTLASVALAATTLAALVLNAGLGWWWADPVAALLIAGGLALEGVRVAVRHRFG